MFTTAVRVERDLGVPSVSFNTLTGHRSCTPEDCSELVANSPQGPVPVSGVFPVGAIFHLLETRLQAVWLSPCRADPPARHPYAWAWTAGFLACCCPRLPFRDRVSHQIQRHLLSSLPAARAIQQCTSWRTDYYGHYVPLGLALRRGSHVRPCCTSERDLGAPLIPLNIFTRYRSILRRLRRLTQDANAGDGTGFRRLSGGRRAFAAGDWSIKQSSHSPYRAGPPTPRSIRLDTTAGFLPCCCPLNLSAPG
jgi:hypothetical protein